MLAAMLLPALQTTRQKAKYARWLGYKNNLRCDPSLVAYYTFEEAKDATGNPNATLENMATVGDFSKSTIDFSGYSDPEKMNGEICEDATGVSWLEDGGRWTEKCALDFGGGSNDYVNCGNDAKLNFGTGNFTLETWIKGSSYGSKNTILTKWESSAGGEKGYIFSVNSGKLATSIGTVNPVILSTQTLSTGVWYHVVAVRSGDNAYQYINAQEDDSCSGIALKNAISQQRLRISTDNDSFDGLIGEVAIYNRALSAQEIKKHYKMGRP